MKRHFYPIVMMVLLLLAPFNLSWSQCPEDPVDLGECDTLHVLPWETDTCFIGCDLFGCDTICVNNPGEEFPRLLFVPLLVTHDSNTFYWGGGAKWVQDSISGFVIPLAYTRTNQSVYCSLSTYWNENQMNPYIPQFRRSVWRHFHHEELDSNRMALLWFQFQNLEWSASLNFSSDSSWYHGATDSFHVPPYMFASILPTSPSNRRWWEGEKTLLFTLTFLVEDTMHICIDSTWWPPSSNLAFSRYDAVNYVPRDNLPLCIWVGPPRIEVTSPNGGESWGVGEVHDITWLSEEFSDDVMIEYSTNAGTDWNTIIPGTANDGVHPWTIPNTPSAECRVRVSDAADGDPSDTSDADFTILGSASITVTSPNGGENWCAGSNQSITWTATGVTDVVIEFSTNGGANWDTITASTPNDGEHSWDIPPDLSTSTTCRVRISDLDADPSDISDADFTITGKYVEMVSPNGGEVWIVDSTYNITWTDSCVEDVSLEYSTDDGATWNPIVASTPSDGSHPWQVPDAPSDSCLVKICDVGSSPCDVSDDNFSIVRPDFAIEVEPETLTVIRGESGDYRVILTSLYGFSGVCSLSVAGLPGGATGTFTPPEIDLGAAPVDTSILTVTLADTTSPDTLTLTVTASEKFKQIEHSKDVVLIVPPPDFTLELSPDTLEIYPNTADSFQVTLTSINGFNSPCTLTVDGLDTVGTGVFHPDTQTPTGTSFLVITDTTTQEGVYPITITATEMDGGKGDPVQHDTIVYLRVLPPFSFMVEALPDTQWVKQGDDTTFNLWIITNVPNDGPCTLSVLSHTLPDYSTAAFDDSIIEAPYSDTAILTITTADSTPEGAYPILIEGRLLNFRDTTEVVLVVQTQTDVEDEIDQPNVPDKFALFQNQPNPFNPVTRISYYLSEGCKVKLTIYNILGRKIKTLFEGYQDAGLKTLDWNGRDDQGGQLGSGIYFYRLQAGEFNQTRKMTLIK